MNAGQNPLGPLKMDEPYEQGEPLDMDDARRASSAMAQKRRDAEDDLRRSVEEVIDAENTYRKSVAIVMVELRDEGKPASVLKELAKKDSRVQTSYKEWQMKLGVQDSIKERLRGLEGERAMLRQLMEWSAKINLLERQQANAQQGGF